MSVSLATKVGAAGTITAGGGVAGTYLAWDHITLYEIEREIISGQHTLTVSDEGISDTLDTASRKVVSTIKVTPEGSNASNKTWECKIKAKTTETISTSNSPKSKLEDALAAIKDKSQESDKLTKRRWLVKNCVKNRDPDSSKPNSIISWVEIKATKSGNDWTVDIGNLLKDSI